MSDFAVYLIGFISVALGVYTIRSYHKKAGRFRAEGAETTAKIVDITGSRKNLKALISYEAAGEEQTAELDYYSSGMKVGDNIKIYVSGESPQDFMYINKGPTIMGALFILIGIILFLKPVIQHFFSI